MLARPWVLARLGAILMCAWTSRLPACCLLLGGAFLLGSCDTPQQRALRDLTKLGVVPCGRSLVEAVLRHEPAQTGLLLAAGVYTEQRDSRGRTPLRIAVDNHHPQAALHLMAAHANVNAVAADEVSVLAAAVGWGELGLVTHLLAAGARADGRMADGEIILPWAIREGRMDLVWLMLRAGADPHLKDRQGNPLLHVALDCGRRELVDALIARGADPAAVNANGETTLHCALRRGWLDAVPCLVAGGADPNRPNPAGATPLELALGAGDPELLGVLLQCGADPDLPGSAGLTLLERVIAANDRALLGVLLSRGIDPVLRNGRRELLVEAATAAGRGSLVKLLLDYGSPAGNALLVACTRGDSGMVSLLLGCGVAPNACRVPTFDSPLAAAMRARCDALAACLIAHGAAITTRLAEGQSPLHLAIATGCHRSVKCLLDAGADANAAFHYPVSPAFMRLVRPGVMQWELRMDRNLTPLMLAADAGVPQSAAHLLAAGAKNSVRTRHSQLGPLNFAAQRQDVAMMRALLGLDPERAERRLVIILSAQCARMFDLAGNEIFSSKVSTGRKGFATRTGDFVITDKYRTWTSTIYHASMPYFQRLSCSDFGLHQGYAPGYPASHGCIRVPAGKASQLFGLTRVGDHVQIIP